MSTRFVPSEFATISQAIIASNPGDTIIVAAGVYNEQVNINVANLTLQGAQANVDARTRHFVAANESIITFSTPEFGTGIVNLSAPNIILNGFTIQGTGSIVNSTGAIFAGDTGEFLPNTSTIDVTGMQIIYNIIKNNANGILIASIEPVPKIPNYLVQFNFLQNNSGDPGSGDGQGVFFNNSAGTVMTNVLVTQNLFNGLETSASINLRNVTIATISNNVMNNDNSISVFGTSDVSISGNITSGATGIIPSLPTNTADAIFIGFGNTNTIVTENLIFGATNNGINILTGNSNVAITNNCIEGNTFAGIMIDSGGGSANSDITIHSNNIEMNTPGLLLMPGSYTSADLDTTSNYWNSSSGPNYNNTGPGTGDSITDDNIPNVQTVQFSPFLTTGLTCPSPITLTKLSTSTNVTPGTPVSFQLSFTVSSNGVSFVLTSFTDSLPALTGGLPWTITTQSPNGFFIITGATGSQNLGITDSLPLSISPGTYSVTLSADTNMSDAGDVLTNTATMVIQIGGDDGITQNITASANASVAVCIHGSSMIKLANGREMEISKLQPGELIIGADGKVTSVVEAVPCWAGVHDKFFGNCVIFERDSLGPGVPSIRFAVDAGHPICTQEAYKKNGVKSLQPAKSYLDQTQGNEDEGIYVRTWDAVASLMPGKNIRFDLLMTHDSCKMYIANEIVVQARQERRVPGYQYE
jgi:hypothetical protein